MVSAIEYELDEFRARRYFLWANTEPDYDRPESFVVNVHFKTAASYSNVEIARIDTEHGYTHFHQLYRERQPTKPYDGGLWDAIELLRSNWRTYARLHCENHDW